jgi:hypothetical protein
MIKNILKKLTSSTDDPDRMRKKQYIMMGGILTVGLTTLYLMGKCARSCREGQSRLILVHHFTAV